MLIIAAMVGFAVFSFLNKEPAARRQSGGDIVQQYQEASSPMEKERLIKDEIARTRERQLQTREEFEKMEKEFGREPAAQQQSGGDSVQQILDAKSPFEKERLIKDHIAQTRERQLKTQEERKQMDKEFEERWRAAEERRKQFNAAYGQ